MASFQNSKFKNKVQKPHAYTPHALTRTRPLHGQMIPQLHGWEATEPPTWRWRVVPWHCGDAMPWRCERVRLIGIGADCKGGMRGKLFCFLR